MSVRTDVINLLVNVNGNQAQNQLNDLRKKASEIKLEMDGLKKNTQAYIDKKAELKKVTDEMDDLKKKIGITSLTQKELNAELKKLNALKGSVAPFTKEFFDLEKQIKAVKDRLYDVNNGVTGFASFFSKIKDEVKQFGAMAAAYLGFEFITDQVTGMVKGAGKLSDQLADIRAKTGMTTAEAKALNKELGQADTRTTTKDLRDIATVGGQLGVAKQDVEGFTLSMDKLNVTLGDEFGNNVEELTNRTAKIRNTFGELRSDHIDVDLLHIGNALQVLAQNGVATAPVVTDFAQRIGSAGTVYGMTAGQVFGLSASYQEMGITAERGGTATVKLLQKISAAPQMFLDIVKGVDPSINSLDKFKNLVNTDITKVLLLVAQGFASSKGNATEFAEKLADAEIGSAAISEVLSKLGQNTDMVSGKIKLAGDALNSTSSIEEQFAIKNETFGATLDKLGKEFNSLATSGAVTGFLQGAVTGLLNFIRWLKELPQWVADNRTALIALTTVVLTYAAAQAKATSNLIIARTVALAKAAVDRIVAAAQAVAAAATAAYGFVVDVVTGKVKLATLAQQLWNFMLKQNPLVWVISIVGALATAISWLASKTNELTAAQKLNNEVQQRVADNTAAEIGQAKMLFNALQQKNLSHQQTAGLLKQLIALNPEYLSGLTAQNITTQQGKDILDKYISSLRTKAELEAKSDLLKEKYKARDQAFASIRGKAGFENKSDAQLADIAQHTVETDEQSSLFGIATGDPTLNGVNLNTLKKNIADIKLLEADLTKSVTDNVTNAVNGAGAAAAGANKVTLKALKEQLKGLQDAYEVIDITNTKALHDNAAARKRLEQQIADLEGKKTPGDKKQERTYAELKKQAENFYKDVEQLRRHVATNEEDENNAALNAIKNKYGDLIQKVKDYNAEVAKSSLTKLQKKGLTDQGNADINALLGLQGQEISNYWSENAKKQFEKTSKEEYAQAKTDLETWFNDQNALNTKNYTDGLITLDQYEKEKHRIELLYSDMRVATAKDYAKTVKQAGEDVVTFTKQQQAQITDDLINQTKAREELARREADAREMLSEMGVNKNDPASKRALANQRSRTRFNKSVDGIKDLLSKSGQDASDDAVKATDSYKAAFEQMQQELAQNSKDFWQGEVERVMQWVGYVQQAMSSLNQILTNSENRRMQQEIAANDKRKKSYADQLNNKLISQARYDLQVKKIDEQQDKDQKKLQYEQAKREKAIKLFEAIINTAAAVAKALPNIPLSIAAGVLGGLQIAAVASQPLPSMGTGGALANGPYHSDAEGGLHVINPRTGKVEMLLEKDEGVLKGSAMRSNQQFTVTGTPSQIASALNAAHGGVNWATGGKLVEMPRWWSKPAQINPQMPAIMAGGGAINQPSQSQAAAGSDNAEVVLAIKEQNRLIAENTAEIKTMKTKLHAVVSIKEYREQEKIYDASAKASGFNQ